MLKEIELSKNEASKNGEINILNEGKSDFSLQLKESQVDKNEKIESEVVENKIKLDQKVNTITQNNTNDLINNENNISKDNEEKYANKDNNNNLIPVLDEKIFPGNNSEKKDEKIENMEGELPDYYSKKLIYILLEFLNSDEELNIVLLGYFSKIILSLINKCRIEILTILYEKQVMERLVYHSYNKSISEIILKMVIKPDLPESGLGEINDINDKLKEELVLALIQSMIESDSTDQIILNAQIIARLTDSKQ